MNNDLFAGEKSPEALETMLLSVVGSYALDTLLDIEQLRQHKEQCLERLRVQDSGKRLAHYAEQAILANLDWGMDALEEAICSSSEESRKARLQHAEKMLQVCALLDTDATTAGVPNSYLSAWAHLNLAFVWKLRNDDRNAAKHMMDMFMVDPYYARVDFAPVLWEHLFQSHLTSITAWYSEQRHNILQGDSSDGQVSCSPSDDSYATAGMQSLLSSVSAEQASQLQHLENLYQDSLDDHTRRYARHYKNGLVSDSLQKLALFPIAEPPMTPLREVGTRERRLYEEPDLSPIHENRSFMQKGSTTASSGELTAKDFFLNLSCNPMWEEDESMEVADKMDNVNMESTKFYDSDVGLLQGGSSKAGIDNSWSQEEGADTYRHLHVEQKKMKIPSMRKRTQSQSPDLREGQQQEASDCSASLSPRDTYSHPNVGHQFPSEYSLSISSDSESELEMEDAKSQPLGRTESMDSCDRRRSLSNSDSSSYVRKDAKATVPDTPSGHGLQVKTSYLGEIEKANLVTRAPKDFVCPITGHLFNDPVTLETGQTYERRAIQEWMDRGNSTCPITRQTLSSSSLPKTNYVLKRLIASWKEQNFDVAQELSSFSRPQTPPSVIYHSKLRRDQVSIDSPQGSPCSTSSSSSRAAQANRRQSADSSPESPAKTPHRGRMLSDLKHILSILCTSEDLQECEDSLLIIKQILSQAKGHQHVEKYLREAGVIDSIVEVLFNSNSAEVWDAGIVVLSGLAENNDLVRDLIRKADVNLECILSLLTRGVTGAVILLHQLKLPISEISKLNLLPYLIRVIKEGNTRQEPALSVNPKTAALNMLCELVSMEDSKKNGSLVQDILSTDAMLALIQCLKEKNSEQKLKALSLLLYCIQADGECRDFISHEANIPLVLELLHCGNSTARLVAISFLAELAHQSRRTANSKILKTIKEEGMLSSMHVLLAYLQLAPLEQRPLTASLLLQLDLLEEPQKRSMYRDEAMEALIESLTNKESVIPQVIAAETLVALIGRFSTSGKPSTEQWLLRIAELGDSSKEHADLQSCEWIEDKEEECASKIWEKRVAKALLGYEHGTILQVLSQHILSKTPEVSKPSIVTAVWLLQMLPLLPDTGLRTIACNCLLNPFLYIFKSSRNNEKQVLAALALHSFLDHSESVQKLASNAKELCGLLRQLQRMTWVEKEIFSVIVKDPSVNAAELWVHEDVGQIDLSLNGSIRAFARARGHIFSGHSDGTIKVWDGKSRLPSFVHETKKHSKAITTLVVSQSTDKLYSGSLDKRVRVWTLESGKIQCIQVLEQRDGVNAMVVNGPMTCIVPQSAGIQVQYENLDIKILNLGKHVQSVAYSDGKIYCGCIDSSIQELDPKEGSSVTIQSSAKTLIGKKPIYALQVFKNKIFAAGALIDGAAVKIWNQADKCLVGTVVSATSAEVRAMAVNDYFLYIGTSTGVVEVWLRERLTRIAAFNIGSKVTCLLLNGNMLFCGSEDGKMRMFASS